MAEQPEGFAIESEQALLVVCSTQVPASRMTPLLTPNNHAEHIAPKFFRCRYHMISPTMPACCHHSLRALENCAVVPCVEQSC